MICMPGLHRHALAPVDERVPRDHPHRRSQAQLLPGDERASGRHFTPEDSYRSVRLGLAEGAERRRDDGPQLGAQHPLARARRRRAARHARHGRARPPRLRHAAGRSRRAADGSRRPRADPARVDAQRRHAHARHLLAQRRRFHESPARQHLGRDRAQGLGRRARARAADHHAHLGAEPGEAAGGREAAGARRAARPSAAHHRGGAPDPEGARRELQHLADRRDRGVRRAPA